MAPCQQLVVRLARLLVECAATRICHTMWTSNHYLGNIALMKRGIARDIRTSASIICHSQVSHPTRLEQYILHNTVDLPLSSDRPIILALWFVQFHPGPHALSKVCRTEISQHSSLCATDENPIIQFNMRHNAVASTSG